MGFMMVRLKWFSGVVQFSLGPIIYRKSVEALG